ncbi:MAG: NAD(+) diphosphatase [Psychrobacter sp.]|uniref:NAD(+) diphosphatase n=1 Tax=Psychrobacter sp. TaxID=56811 RepID=UPI002649AF6C|nr:NAD(+) diphosphatase [Psychrobacter sp.]MDN5620153.1 NAD(+) diphosphatase [Psychrobacter sp.]
MAHAFILSDDTVLCRQMPDGWWPLQVQLPQGSMHLEDQANQVGYVSLQESLSPSHWHSDSNQNDDIDSPSNDVIHKDTAQTFTAPPAFAMTYDYAVAHHVTLPIIAESSSDTFVPYRQLINNIPVALSDQISQAIQLLRWQTDTQFCSRCASPTVHADQGERAMVCPVCQLRQYPRVQPCVITAITRPNPVTDEMQILLAHHHRHGQQKLPPMYGLIAGFVEVGENLEHAVVREVAEEVNISVSDIRYVSSQPWPFPSNLMLGFQASYAGGEIVIQEEELAHADFFDLSNLPKIPPKGSIARELIDQVAEEQGILL